MLEGLAPRFEHFFLGDHALGGLRFTLEKTRLWYERLYRLLPDISFDLRAIRISGPPWNTLVTVDWLESNSGTDGVRTFTSGVHVVRLAWGSGRFIWHPRSIWQLYNSKHIIRQLRPSNCRPDWSRFLRGWTKKPSLQQSTLK